MLPRAWKLRIRDILDSMNHIKSFIAGMNQEQFRSDKKTYLAIVRCLEIIGEASHHVPDTIKNKYADIPWRKLKDFRNVLAHQYFGVDDEIVWKTIHDDLLPLGSIFEKIMSSERE
ncbi:MAG: DUF86 domain-containing protein [Pseudomonadota bacterium]|nr:DUF86 domain-containing protein [Pseudomonadota bacterium]